MLARIGFILEMHTGTVVFRPTLNSYKGEMYERFTRINALFFDFLYFQFFSVTRACGRDDVDPVFAQNELKCAADH